MVIFYVLVTLHNTIIYSPFNHSNHKIFLVLCTFVEVGVYKYFSLCKWLNPHTFQPLTYLTWSYMYVSDVPHSPSIVKKMSRLYFFVKYSILFSSDYLPLSLSFPNWDFLADYYIYKGCQGFLRILLQTIKLYYLITLIFLDFKLSRVVSFSIILHSEWYPITSLTSGYMWSKCADSLLVSMGYLSLLIPLQSVNGYYSYSFYVHNRTEC